MPHSASRYARWPDTDAALSEPAVPHTLLGQLSAAICLLVCGYALLRGGLPERIAALGLCVSLAAMVLFQDRVHWLDPQHRILANDACLLLLLAILATSWRRVWLIPATAAQGLGVMLHFELAFHPEVSGLTFMTANNALDYLVLASLAWGTWSSSRARRQAPVVITGPSRVA